MEYIKVTFNDGSFSEVPITEWDTLLIAWSNCIDNNKDGIYICNDICGGKMAFRLLAVQDMFTSSPTIRERSREINEEIKKEGWVGE